MPRLLALETRGDYNSWVPWDQAIAESLQTLTAKALCTDSRLKHTLRFSMKEGLFARVEPALKGRLCLTCFSGLLQGTEAREHSPSVSLMSPQKELEPLVWHPICSCHQGTWFGLVANGTYAYHSPGLCNHRKIS